MLMRQGDVYLATVVEVPSQAVLVPHHVLAEGEATGHAHRILETERAKIWEFQGQRYLEVREAAVTLVHDEHAAITIGPGYYRFWQQREYTPRGIEVVRD